MSYYVKQGKSVFVTQDKPNFQDSLPVGVYAVKFDDRRKEYYLDEIEPFKLPSKVYGTANQNVERTIKTFLDRSNSTGILLNGEKGSGKTLFVKQLSVNLANIGISTLVINSEFSGEEFNQFIQSIDQPALVMFDEFEKVYSSNSQDEILTLLDGAYPSKKLYALTCNNSFSINRHMINRPGRIYYYFDFTGLDQEFVRNYCEDKLVNKNEIESVVKYSILFGEFNFDMLQAIVEEMNRYNESVDRVVKFINTKPSSDDGGRYELKVTDADGNIIPMYTTFFNGNPLKSNNELWTNYASDDIEDYGIEFDYHNLVEANGKDGFMKFRTDDGVELTFTPKRENKFDFSAF